MKPTEPNIRCNECGGTGFVEVPSGAGNDPYYQKVACDACGGTGRITKLVDCCQDQKRAEQIEIQERLLVIARRKKQRVAATLEWLGFKDDGDRRLNEIHLLSTLSIKFDQLREAVTELACDDRTEHDCADTIEVLKKAHWGMVEAISNDQLRADAERHNRLERRKQ